jgi:hypothetical protein
MIKKKIIEFLKTREFISVATCDFAGRPNAASKFILRLEDNAIYLVDYIIGRTCHNLKANPRASLSFVDTNTLTGYQINGPVEIIDKGPEYETAIKELRQKEIDLSTRRIIEGVTKGKSHQAYEVATSEKSIIFKVKMEEVVEMRTSGTLKREKYDETKRISDGNREPSL